MSMTTHRCNKCNDNIFADDEHNCWENGKVVDHYGNVPDTQHFAILKFGSTGSKCSPNYIVFLDKNSWKDEISKLTEAKVHFVALKVTPANVKSYLVVEVD